MSTLNVNNINEAGGVDAVITGGVLDSGSLPAGSILQVVSTTKTDAASTTSTSFSDVSGLSVSITPSSATSKVLVSYTVQGNGRAGSTSLFVRLLRDSTLISAGAAAGNRTEVSGHSLTGEFAIETTGGNFLDSPATTSAITYKIAFSSSVSGQAAYINRAHQDTDAATTPRGVSSITVMEVAG